MVAKGVGNGSRDGVGALGLLAALWSSSLGTGDGASAAAVEETPENLILVVVDTLRADHTSVYGYSLNTTPGLSKIAADGVLFERAYAPTSATAPTHATLFTGKYPISHGLLKNGQVLAPETKTLAGILAARGYQTVGIASSFVLDHRFGLDQGFETWLDEFDADRATVHFDTWEGQDVPKGFDRRADETTRRAFRWLWLERDSERPFFLFVHYFDPHSPYQPPKAFEKRFPIPERSDDDDQRRYGTGVQLERRLYDAEIAFTDGEIARLLEAVDGLGIEEDTLVVVTADHGEGLLDHGFWLHGIDVYEEGVWVPLIVRWKGRIPAGRRIAEPVELVDLAPTILGLLRAAPEALPFEGRNLAESLLGDARLPADRPVYLYRGPYPDGVAVSGIPVAGELFAVRRGKLKLIEHTSGDTPELYDLEKDPGETTNLQGSSAEDVSRLSDLLEKWKQNRSAPGRVEALSEENRRVLEALGYAE
jgi:arylsulfatase A-like enzyme